MKKRNLIPGLAFVLIISLLQTGCKPKPIRIVLDPPSGSPGDLVSVQLVNAKIDKNASVTLGTEKPLILQKGDSNLMIMVPPIAPGQTQLTYTTGKQSANAVFQVDEPATVRLWFKISNGKLTFIESQSSNEEFQQDKSYSPERMMYEITDSKGERIVTGYINDPSALEVPTEDKKGLSHVEIKGDVTFSINIPAFKDLNEIRFSEINASTRYKPKPLEPVSLKGAR